MVSPEMLMLSVFITPWMKPTPIQRAISCACRSQTASSIGMGLSESLARAGSCRATA